MSKHFLLTLGFLAIGFATLTAQVKFKLDYEKTTKRYVVSIVPTKSLSMPGNLTGTAQVTVKALSGKFFPTDIVGLYPGLDWDFNARSNAPAEAPDNDYISFALRNAGLLHLPYQAESALPVLSFRNELGCATDIELIDNEKDPFMPPNSEMANVGNSIAVFGIGANAYGGIDNRNAKTDCQEQYTHTNDSDELIADFDLYPIPAETEIFLEFEWGYPSESVRAEIYDITGRAMSRKSIDLVTGHNLHAFHTEKLAAGSYLIKLTGETWTVTLDKFQKIRM